MRRIFQLVLAIAFLVSAREVFSQSEPLAAAPKQERVDLRELSQLIVPVSQVSAAYSLDPLIAEVQVSDGELRVWGRAPGQAVVVLVNADYSTSSMQVTVTQAPPNLPDRVWNGLDSNPADSNGYYEVRYASNPSQVNDTFDYRARRIQLHFANAIVPGRNLPGTYSTWFPYAYLRFLGDRWRLTLLDEIVQSSPISVNNTLLRGMHFTAGGLTLDAGYTSVAGFQSLFLPAYKQLIAGAAFVHHLSPDSQIGITGYFIQRDRIAPDPRTAQGVGTLFFRRKSSHGPDILAEAGMSNGIGGAASLALHSEADQFHVTARYRPRYYAAPDTDNLNGLQSETRWDHVWGQRMISDFSGSLNRIFTRAGTQTMEVAAGNLRYKVFHGISFSPGVSLSSFSDNQALFPVIHRFAAPAAINYDRASFGIGAQYEYSRTSRAFSPGQAYRGSMRWSGQHFQMNANAGLDTQALEIDSVFSAFPDLNAELARLGLGTTTSVQQLAALLQNRAFLNNLGIAPSATLQLVPRNWHAGLNMSWRRALQVLELDSNYNLNSFLTQKNTVVLQTIRYRRGIFHSTELVTSFTLLETISPVRRLSPIWEIGLRHQFGASPFTLLHQHNAAISGTVWVRDSSGTQPAWGAEITLDGKYGTNSDGHGKYSFSRVPPGVHSVQITFRSARPFWYTTPSKVSTQAGSTVDFGIIYPAAQIIGYALNDTGTGMSDIGMLVKGPQGGLDFTTDRLGRFFVPVPQTGDYILRVNAETVPDGYALDELEPVNLSMAEGESKKVSFVLPAIRGLTGSVQAYDPAKGEYVSLPGVTVSLAELGRQIITDENGRYLFRNLPSGFFTILVNGQPNDQVQLSATPQLVHQDLRVSPSALTKMRGSGSSP